MTAPGDAAAGLVVLVVDDDPTLRSLLAELLRELGHRVVTAGDGAEAVREVQRSQPDLVLMDCEMPVLDGLAAAREIRRLPGKAVPIVMVSSRTGAEVRAAAAAAGIVRFVAKPVSLATLQQLLADHSGATS
jgi:CheY-like chemotaxis protein